MIIRQTFRNILSLAILLAAFPCLLFAQQESVSTWDAASFRNWTFIPYWTTQSQLQSFSTDNLYDHVSDVLYFSGVRPTATGGLNYHPWAAQHLSTLSTHHANHGFRYHMSMFDTYGGDTDAVWNSVVSSPANRANFVSNVTSLLQANGMTGFNLDWERPNTDTEWANYTQLAKDLRAAINPLGMEVSVDDFGFSDYDWDDTAVFDAKTYDQLFIMGYHYPAYSNDSLNNNSFANFKLALDDQGPSKAFSDDQLVLGIGTWGQGPSTKTLKSILEADPDLPYDAETWTDGVDTWEIESREQVREKIQLALDRGMQGVMNWTLHYDSPGELGLHRVEHHYIAVQRDVPDLDLDGKVDAADANLLADNMGTVPGWTGMNTAARFDNFFRNGNWNVGDHNGNGFVNQADADWLADRYAALGVNLPDRLAYTGTFESLTDGVGLAGRWSVPLSGGELPETGNFEQHSPGAITYGGTGPGADKHSGASVTLRNQNAAEAYDTLNTAPRQMDVSLSSPIDLGQDTETYFTMLLRENTAPLLSSQLASSGRKLALQFLDDLGAPALEYAVEGSSGEFSIQNIADPAGDDVSATEFASDETFLLIGKLSGNSGGAYTLEASLMSSSDHVADFTQASFPWSLTAQGSSGFHPTISDLRIESLFQTNFTVSNLQIGSAGDFFPLFGDFDDNGIVDGLDFLMWQMEDGSTSGLSDWELNYGEGALQTLATTVPEPGTATFVFAAFGLLVFKRSYRTA